VIEDWLPEGFDYVSDSLVQKNFAGTPQISREQDGAYFIIKYD
jgi:hypothetical protein